MRFHINEIIMSSKISSFISSLNCLKTSFNEEYCSKKHGSFYIEKNKIFKIELENCDLSFYYDNKIIIDKSIYNTIEVFSCIPLDEDYFKIRTQTKEYFLNNSLHIIIKINIETKNILDFYFLTTSDNYNIEEELKNDVSVFFYS